MPIRRRGGDNPLTIDEQIEKTQKELDVVNARLFEMFGEEGFAQINQAMANLFNALADEGLKDPLP